MDELGVDRDMYINKSPGNPKTIVELFFFEDDHCFSRGLQSTIMGDYFMNGL